MASQTPILVQQTASASTTLSPASFAPAFGSATTAGTTLVALVSTANSAIGATITTPAGWTFIGNLNIATLGLWAYVFPNNTGAITTVTFAGLTNLFAISVSLLEFSGMPTTVILDPQTGGPILGAVSSIFVSAASATTLSTASVSPKTANGLWLGFNTCNATSTLGSSNLPASGLGAWNNGTQATSTTGTNNVTARAQWAIVGPTFPSGGSFQVTTTASVAAFIGAAMFDLLSLGSGALSVLETGVPGGVATWTGGGAGQVVGV